MNHLFTTLAYNTAGEVALEGLSQSSGVAKPTIKRYIEYLEAAFLLRRVHRIDHTARRFERARTFKVYLTNPSIRSALFSPIDADHPEVGNLVETAVFAQWFHAADDVVAIHYARWLRGEVDVVNLDREGAPRWAVEVKWSDRIAESPRELAAHVDFCNKHDLGSIIVTTRTYSGRIEIRNVDVEFRPAAIYCLQVGRNLVSGKRVPPSADTGSEPQGWAIGD